MKTITANQRFLNIISKAAALGFEIDMSESFENVYFEAENFLKNDAGIEPTLEYCEVSRGRNQHVNYGDGMGYEFQMTGEICDWSSKEFIAEDNFGTNYIRFPHEVVVDSEANVIQLFDTRPATEEEIESQRAY